MDKESKKVSFYLRLHNGNGCMLNLPVSYTLQRALSILVGQKLSLPTSYRLIVNGRHVRDYSLTIAELGITDNSIVHIEEANVRAKPLSNINVTIFFEGEKIVLQARNNDTVLYLKQKIYQLYNINPQEQLLVFKGCKLKNEKALQHYRIQAGSLICLQLSEQKDSTINSKLVKRQDQLLNSVLSLNNEKISSSRTTLFRSDSIGERKYKDSTSSFDVQIKIRKQIDLEQIQNENNENNQNVELKQSITFNTNVFQFNPYQCNEVYSKSAESQIDLIHAKFSQMQFSQI